MKKFYLLLATLTSAALFSCSDYIEIEAMSDDIASTRSISVTQEYYWFKDIKMPIFRVNDMSYVIFQESSFDALQASLSSMGAKVQERNISHPYIYEETNKTDKSALYLKGYRWTTVNLSPEVASTLPGVIYVAPCYKTEKSNPFPVTNKLYVFLNEGGDYEILERMSKKCQVEIVGEMAEFPNVYLLICTDKSSGNALEVANLMYESGSFKAAEPEFMSANFDTNDPYFSYQWHLNNSGQYGSSYAGYDIKYNQAANASLISSTSSVTVGVVDSGVDLTHPDISLTSFSWNAVTSNSPSGYSTIHGTAMSGIISGITGNSVGIAGVASAAGKTMSINVSDQSGQIVISAAANGIKKAADMGASIINCSWSLETSNYLIENAIYYALTNGRNGKGCIITFCSGNLGGESLKYPASHTPEKDVISVGAISYTGARWSNSNYGTNLDIVAPGVNILTTGENHGYAMATGTSASAAQVSGVAALMLAWNPNLSYDEVGHILKITANKSLPGYTFSNSTYGTWNNEVGYGLLNMYAALDMAKNTSYYSYGNNMYFDGGQTTLNSGGSGYVGTTFTAYPNNNNYKYYWSGSYTGTCDRWFVTPNTPYSSIGNVSVYLNPGQSGVLTVTCRVYNDTTYIGKITQYVYVSY